MARPNLKLRRLRIEREIFGLKSGDEGTLALKTWFDKIGTPTSLAQLGIEGKVLDEVIDVAEANAKAWNMAELYSRENIAKILAFAK